ncbi:hypothetical protein S40293_10746 [Stachybotrys chartarum IBT 40293]|nr:hypothetical protein S40293_10746 [Stachybotrys chartarum IBT 40293]
MTASHPAQQIRPRLSLCLVGDSCPLPHVGRQWTTRAHSLLAPPPFLVRHGIPSVAVHAAAAAAAADADSPAGPSEAHRLPFPAVPTSGRISVARAAVLRRSFWFHTRPVLAGWIAP